MHADHDRIPEQALEWHLAGRKAALATVVQTWGSAPRRVGSQLAVSGDAEIAGSVSGGCVEGAVVEEALEALQDGTCRILEFGVSDDDAFAVGLACGGTIRVMVEPVGVGSGPDTATLQEIVTARAQRRAVGLQIDTQSWTRRILQFADAKDAFTADRSGFSKSDISDFIWVSNPPLRLAVIGGVHIAQPLGEMARSLGIDMVLIDPREAFASAARFPGVTIINEWPDAALAGLAPDHRTAVVALTHDPKLDDPALSVALRSGAFYIGALGSTRTHAKRVARLTEAGFGEQDIARIDAPIGLDIGAASPAEIAVSIAAELTERLRRPATRPGARESVGAAA
ncbi:MAG: XdhC family protein [Pseudomonadota bacterium]